MKIGNYIFECDKCVEKFRCAISDKKKEIKKLKKSRMVKEILYILARKSSNYQEGLANGFELGLYAESRGYFWQRQYAHKAFHLLCNCIVNDGRKNEEGK